MNPFPMLTVLILLPLAGSVAALAFARRPDACRVFCLALTLAELVFLLAALPLAGMPGTFVLREDLAWIPSLGARYSLAMDGISYLLVLMTSFLGVLAVLVSWREIRSRIATHHASLLLVQATAIGIFLARDLLLFYLFWELQLVPVFFLIAVWGHEARRRAAFKFLLFSIAGGLLMLLAVIGLYVSHGVATGSHTFALSDLLASPASPSLQVWLLAGFLLGLAVKTPIIPLHIWLPDAHTQAPTAGSLLLAGVLLKTGSYGLLRWALPLFPHAAAQAAPLLIGLGLTALIYGAWVCFAQTDVKRLVAYSSIGHMGLILLGLAVWDEISLQGSVLQMVNHALTTGALFIMVGMLHERTGSRDLSDLGGLWQRIPVFSTFFLLFCLAAAGLPGLNNFVGELLILVGSFEQRPAAACVGFAGAVLTLGYILRLVQATLFGPGETPKDLADITPREAAIVAPLAGAVLFIGLNPSPVLDLLRAPVQTLLAQWGV
jgi:NADH-quinone oxidoreductase subunit M